MIDKLLYACTTPAEASVKRIHMFEPSMLRFNSRQLYKLFVFSDNFIDDVDISI